jgi:V/A-type H+-transporting ATPase subunit E
VNGLEAILNRIKTDAEDKIRDINDQANARCSELLTAADHDAEKIISDAKRLADVQATVLLRRSESLSALETRKLVLSARQTLINEVIGQAADYLVSLPDDEKQVLYQRLLLTHAQGDESVVFAQKDAALSERVLSTTNQEKNWHLTAAPEQGNFSGGVVLRQGLIVTNLTLELLIRSNRPELISLAAHALFSI